MNDIVVKETILKTDLAKEHWGRKYRYGNELVFFDTAKRVCRTLANNEVDSDYWYDKFINTMIKFDDSIPVGIKTLTGGRITANIGTEYNGATLMNCFINGPVSNATIEYTRGKSVGLNIPIKIQTPDTSDNMENIFLTILEQAKTLSSEGGWGMNFSWIRPRSSKIKGAGVRHPGVVTFMEVFDSVAMCVVKGDEDGYKDKLKNYLSDDQIEKVKGIVSKEIRKGAMMGVLDVSHPDIEEFVRAKQKPGVLTKFNLSVLIPDEFMIAVNNDDMWELKFDNKVYKIVKAKELYDLIMESTYNRAEPGVLYEDTMQRNNPVSYLGKVNATNPCGEIPGNPETTTVCLLGSINLTQYVGLDRKFDFDTYTKDVSVFARMLDNVCDLTNLPLPSYEWSVKNLRQYGMGVIGIGSALIMMGLKYGSKESVDFVRKIAKLKENITIKVSALLAKEKGKFPAFTEQYYETEYFKSDRLDDDVKELVRLYGVRNAKTTTNAPTGNASVILDNVTNGVEPAFMLEYIRTAVCKEWHKDLSHDYIINNFKELTIGEKETFKAYEGVVDGDVYYYEPERGGRGLCKKSIVRDYGYSWLCENFPDEVNADYIVTTNDLSVDAHIDIQKVVQRYNNQSTSKTINLPNDFKFEDFKDLYMKAWRDELIGVTTYRDGTMSAVLSKIEESDIKDREIIKEDLQCPSEFVNGNTTVIKREHTKYYINFSYLPDDSEFKFPFAIWITTNNLKSEMEYIAKSVDKLANLAINKGVSDKIVNIALGKIKHHSAHNKLARMISLNLRHNVSIADIVGSLKDIDGDNISTLLTAIRKFLSSKIKDGEKVVGAKCPQCEGNNLEYSAGCSVCKDCGFSGCN